MKIIIFLAVLLSFNTFAQDRMVLGKGINHGYISGEEYWPFVAGMGSPYPERVIWDFDQAGEKIGKAVQECALKGNKQLVSWLENVESPVSKRLKDVKELGGTTAFFMWTNDYTKDQNNSRRRANRVWRWCNGGCNSGAGGLLKFESTVAGDGTCLNPEESQVTRFLDGYIAELASERANQQGNRSIDTEIRNSATEGSVGPSQSTTSSSTSDH